MTDRITTVTMPKWGMTMTEGKVAGWLKSVGDRIEPGEEFVEVETEKITNVVEAQAAGLLRRILVQTGQSAPVGAPIAILAEPDVTEEELDAVATSAAEAVGGEGGLSESTVEAAGLRLRVVSAGTGESAPLVLLHGFASDTASWMFVQEPLAAGRRVHALDLPSHGASDVDARLASVEALAETVRAAIDQLAPGELHLAGHSLGGRLALRIAAGLGDRLRSLALIAPAGLGAGSEADFPAAYLAADKRRPMKEALRLLVAEEDAVTSEMVERALAAKRIDGAAEALSAINDDALATASEGAQAELVALALPVLTVWGAADRVVPPPGGSETVLPGVGHMPQMEAAAQVAELMRRHMEAAE